MPQRKKGARLYFKKRKDGRASVYIIREAGCSDISTGTEDLAEAQRQLAEHIGQRDAVAEQRAEDLMTVLSIYARERAPLTASPARIGYALEPLIEFWNGKALPDVRGATCRAYADWRGVSDGTIRRELGVLRAAINYCFREGHVSTAPPVTLPPKPAARERWLTVQEAAYLLKASRHLRQDGRHLSKFILTCLYTGTRKSSALALRIDQPSTTGGYVDTKEGVLYRKPAGLRETKKRQPAVRLPKKYLAHVRRWTRSGCRFVVESSRGNRVADIRKGFSRALKIAEALAGKDGVTLDLSDVSPHTLRHTAITWSLQGGGSIWDAAGYFGASPETIERTYGHHSPDHMKSAVTAMQRLRGSEAARR